MDAITYTKARESLAKTMDRVWMTIPRLSLRARTNELQAKACFPRRV
jgi:hypothetical protein